MQLRRRSLCEAEKQAQAGHGARREAQCSCCGETETIPFIFLCVLRMQDMSSKKAADSAPMHSKLQPENYSVD